MTLPQRSPRARAGASTFAARSLVTLLLWGTGAGAGCARVTQPPGASGNAGAGAGSDGRDAGFETSVLGGDGGGLITDAYLTSDADEMCASALHAVVRDFRGQVINDVPKHPDFEFALGDRQRDCRESQLGPDDKPVYARAGGTTPTTNGADTFNQWYRDVDGVNIHFDTEIPLTPDPTRPGTFVYDDDAYFPIDDMGFGNEYQSHNFDFTDRAALQLPVPRWREVHVQGRRRPVAVPERQAGRRSRRHPHRRDRHRDLDAVAVDFGLAPMGVYRMDIFQAERHLAESHFHVETTLKCVSNVVIP